jgi:FkbM family methyltransferase
MIFLFYYFTTAKYTHIMTTDKNTITDIVSDLVIKDIYRVKKYNVDHAFALTDCQPVNVFLKQHFHSWESLTFETFQLVKDQNSTAIDLGAWIGTTAIWLSKNFGNVICVEADNESIKHITVNLQLSSCNNAIICGAPIAADCDNLIFGPRSDTWNFLNNSTSYIKDKVDSVHDYKKRCTTLKKIIYDYALELDNKVSFIKCDIEGGEAPILDDILYYCLINNVSAFLSFHVIWWNSNYKLEDFAHYFQYFDCYNVTVPIADPLKYIKQDPFCSLLFKPCPGLLHEPKQLTDKIKKINPTVLITSYKSTNELEQALTEIKKQTNDIIILSDDKTIVDKFPYFILDNTNPSKREKFIKFLQENNCVVLDAEKVSLLGSEPSSIKNIIA